MEKIGTYALFIVVMIALNFGGNLVAQRVLPTTETDPLARRMAYKAVFLLSLLGAIGLLIVIEEGFDL
ncbi:hypothetical protein [Croceicoccus gelatinilyticus]|uniref:hypothetical protein n=1 Tax=Croceicoccus gelatinilyticus TaxID=2835536 RepID=UPI001BCBE4B2|nr:hypothetical protein [Croceicoccus gelatinilyticus]MBS7671736.1 hypothetical protein [Croceicoccus gelatinilyticus]